MIAILSLNLQVEIEHNRKTYRFVYDDWLQKGKNGLADCRVQLFPGNENAKSTSFKVGQLQPRHRCLDLCDQLVLIWSWWWWWWRRQVVVNTSDIRGAGTDSNISCVVYGDHGDTGVRKLDSSANDFERGTSCTFMLKSPNIGAIQSIRISSDNSGFGAAWHLKDIEVGAALWRIGSVCSQIWCGVPAEIWMALLSAPGHEHGIRGAPRVPVQLVDR